MWYCKVTSHIGWLAVYHNLSTEGYLKNNLSDIELELIYNYTMKEEDANFVRPGSITVYAGYEADAERNILVDETLRWSDVDFYITPGNRGIAVRLLFRYIKGYRDPHGKLRFDPQRTFTFLPTKTTRYHLDLAFILTGLAFQRGLFGPEFPTIESLHLCKTFQLPKVDRVNAHPILLQSTKGDTLFETKAMKTAGLNARLKTTLLTLGFVQRFTMYSFRRTAIIETRQNEGTEEARELATHAPGTTSIYAYDNIGNSDKDITAVRLGEPGVAREEIRRLFNQALQVKADIESSFENGPVMVSGLRREMDEFVRSSCDTDEACQTVGKAYEAFIKELVIMKRGEDISKQQIRRAIDSLSIADEEKINLHTKLDELQRTNKAVRKEATKKFIKKFKETKIQEIVKSTTIAEVEARMGAKGHLGRRPREVQKHLIGLVNSLDKDDHGEDSSLVNEEVEEEALRDPREESEAWKDLPEKVVLESEEPDNETERSTLKDRLTHLAAFIKAGEGTFLLPENATLPTVPITTPGPSTVASRALESSNSQRVSNSPGTTFQCHLCFLDWTAPAEKKQKIYRNIELDRHLSTDYHSRLSILKRIAENEQRLQGSGKLACQICDDAQFATPFKLVDHMNKVHGYN
ncbi:hypothetical protein BCON_0680g00020 [Botryotinia convoluta]|uniref:Uncharacterized protein n=1 Tax=Botryotinia convoluta TaxID=54673 RepID=A0A4Z1H945_9HELO|nr:hypothetical protein BCON_0680g00020 [Botryotinia convoluta]